jgi:hypothetical protein
MKSTYPVSTYIANLEAKSIEINRAQEAGGVFPMRDVAGMIDFALRRASNIHWQARDINREAHARQKLQKPVCLWFTGLSASG